MDGKQKRTRLMLIACAAAVAAGVIAVAVFGVPLRSVLVFAMVAACPLMHLFMGHGMAHGSHDHEQQPSHKQA